MYLMILSDYHLTLARSTSISLETEHNNDNGHMRTYFIVKSISIVPPWQQTKDRSICRSPSLLASSEHDRRAYRSVLRVAGTTAIMSQSKQMSSEDHMFRVALGDIEIAL